MLTMVIEAGSPLFGAAERLELEMFGLGNGWAGDIDLAAGRMVVYDDFRERSAFAVVLDDGAPGFGAQALSRVVYGVPGDLESMPVGRDYHVTYGLRARGRSLLDAAWRDEYARRVTPTAELATQAKWPGVAHAAVRATWACWLDRLLPAGVGHLTMAVLPSLRRQYGWINGPALRTIGETLEGYVGADSIPAELDLHHPRVERFRRQRVPAFLAAHPDHARVGLDGLVERLGSGRVGQLCADGFARGGARALAR